MNDSITSGICKSDIVAQNCSDWCTIIYCTHACMHAACLLVWTSTQRNCVQLIDMNIIATLVCGLWRSLSSGRRIIQTIVYTQNYIYFITILDQSWSNSPSELYPVNLYLNCVRKTTNCTNKQSDSVHQKYILHVQTKPAWWGVSWPSLVCMACVVNMNSDSRLFMLCDCWVIVMHFKSIIGNEHAWYGANWWTFNFTTMHFEIRKVENYP